MIVSIIIILISLVITLFIGLLPVVIKILKWTGLWVTLIYLVVIIALGSYIMRGTNDITPHWVYIGLYISLGISGVFFIWNVIKGIRTFVERVRGY